MAGKTVKLSLPKTYHALIRNSVGTHFFRTIFASVNGRTYDILRDGELSCAFFVSGILFLCRLIKEPHATVTSTVHDLKRSGWKAIAKPRIGAVLVWEDAVFADGEIHKHMGFSVGNNKAISNSYTSRVPIEHHWTFGMRRGKPNRKVEAILWNKKLS